jgi:predicted unusual protein kinase regulating ubiquinone biosynthesis (AarF/ABC1/UbiB family)
MAISSEKINQYRKLLSFILKYWNSDLFKDTASSALGTEIEIDAEKENEWYDQSPEELVNDLEQMGATYVKLGQLLSTRPDFLPDRYLDALSDLQDKAEPIPYDEIQHIVETELNTGISNAFENFDSEPMASASIGQVHKATLRSGKEAAVKVQRPGIREQFLNDLNTLTDIANWAVEHTATARKYAVDVLIEDLRRILSNELDYKKEAQNLSRLHYNLRSFDKLIVPLPISDYTTSKVLTMEFIAGQKVVDLAPVKQIEMNSEELVDELVEAYLKQILVDGFVHADPHPGNIHLTKDYRIALLDLGMVAQISPMHKDYLLQLMTALSEDSGEKIADILIEMGELHDEHNLKQFRKTTNHLVMESQHAAAKEMKTGRLLLQMNQSAAQNGIDIPTEINILGKVLLNLDQIISTLAPDFNLRKAIRKHVWKLMENKMRKELKPESFMSTLLATKKLAELLPERLNKITELLANNEYKLKVDAIDEKRFTDGFQKVANRITLGLIIAATIIGAAMLMNVPTEFTLLGYPGLAIIFFLMAAIGGTWLVYYIVFEDEDFK